MDGCGVVGGTYSVVAEVMDGLCGLCGGAGVAEKNYRSYRANRSYKNRVDAGGVGLVDVRVGSANWLEPR